MRATCGASCEGRCARLGVRAPLQGSLTRIIKLVLEVLRSCKDGDVKATMLEVAVPSDPIGIWQLSQQRISQTESFEAYIDAHCCHGNGRRPLSTGMAREHGHDEQRVFCCCQVADASAHLLRVPGSHQGSFPSPRSSPVLQEGRKGTKGHERSASMAELSCQEKRGVGTGNKARSG